MFGEDPSILELRGPLGETALHYLAIERCADAVRLLLALGANADPRNEFGSSLLQECTSIARAGEDWSFVGDLLRHGADPYHYSDTLCCAWHQAATTPEHPLHVTFKELPTPPTSHEDCEIFFPSDDEDAEEVQ